MLKALCEVVCDVIVSSSGWRAAAAAVSETRVRELVRGLLRWIWTNGDALSGKTSEILLKRPFALAEVSSLTSPTACRSAGIFCIDVSLFSSAVFFSSPSLCYGLIPSVWLLAIDLDGSGGACLPAAMKLDGEELFNQWYLFDDLHG